LERIKTVARAKWREEESRPKNPRTIDRESRRANRYRATSRAIIVSPSLLLIVDRWQESTNRKNASRYLQTGYMSLRYTGNLSCLSGSRVPPRSARKPYIIKIHTKRMCLSRSRIGLSRFPRITVRERPKVEGNLGRIRRSHMRKRFGDGFFYRSRLNYATRPWRIRNAGFIGTGRRRDACSRIAVCIF